MHPEIKANFQEKLRLNVSDLINSLDEKLKDMYAKHSASGQLRSGNTIKRTMDLIAEGDASLYQTSIEYLREQDISYSESIETDIQSLVESAQKNYKIECLERLKKSTELAGIADLYGKMLPKVESVMLSELAKFHNSLNAVIVQLKLNKQISPLTKTLWVLEALIILTTMFIAGMWFNDPSGNYEPIVVGLSLAFPLLLVGIKLSTNKVT